jgi:hypothetical protein
MWLLVGSEGDEMTEEEWLNATDPTPMLRFLRDKASDRKFRLFGVACCRSIWHLLPNEAARTVVSVAERFAEGVATEDELGLAQEAFSFAGFEADYPHDTYIAAVAQGAVEQLARESDITFARRTRRVVPNWPEQAYEAASGAAHGATFSIPGPTQRAEQLARLSALLRDIFGNPFRPVAVDPSWLTSEVRSLAEGIYEYRAFDQMPILADALQDAGCDNEDVLTHCRQPGEHVRGCWVVDLLLGKS